MTIRELIKKLQECDDDILDYKVGVTAQVQLNKNTRMFSRCGMLLVPDDVDVDNKVMWLKARTETSFEFYNSAGRKDNKEKE